MTGPVGWAARMRLGVLFSGGKDSVLALELAREAGHDVVCLITMVSKNPASYMFHTPNIGLTALQARAMGLPHIVEETDGEKEAELSDLRRAVGRAVSDHGIGGVASGAIASRYQADRIGSICAGMGLASITPLWGMDQEALLCRIVAGGYRVVITGVFAEPLGEDWLGRELDGPAVDELVRLGRERGINPAGEGGEIETTVLFAPPFYRRLRIVGSERRFGRDSGVLVITEAELV